MSLPSTYKVTFPRRAGLVYSIECDYSEAGATLFDGKSTRTLIKGEFPANMFDYTAKAIKMKAITDGPASSLAIKDGAEGGAKALETADGDGCADEEGEEEEGACGGEEEVASDAGGEDRLC